MWASSVNTNLAAGNISFSSPVLLVLKCRWRPKETVALGTRMEHLISNAFKCSPPLSAQEQTEHDFSWIFHNILRLQFLRVYERYSFPSQSSTLRWRESQNVRRSPVPVTNWPHAAFCLWQCFLCCSSPSFTDMTSRNPSRSSTSWEHFNQYCHGR